ncbi:hypothetical protein VN0622_12090 [Helicobacter pylori]
MWSEKIIKIIPAVLFLFCLLECFELVLIINNLNKIEKLEVQFKENLEVLKHEIGFFKDKKIKVK